MEDALKEERVEKDIVVSVKSPGYVAAMGRDPVNGCQGFVCQKPVLIPVRSLEKGVLALIPSAST